MRSRPPLLVQLLFCGAAALFIYSATTPLAQQHSLPSVRVERAPSPSSAGTVVTAADGASNYWLPPAGGSRTAARAVSGCAPEPGPKTQRQLVPIPATPCQAADDVACRIASRAPDRLLLLMLAEASPDREPLLMAARDAVAPGQLLLVPADARASAWSQSLGLAWWRPQGSSSPTASLWRAASLLVRAGCSVVVSGGRVRWHGSPFAHLSRDVDLEVAQLGITSRGSVVGVHDQPMGWSAYGQTMTCPLLDPNVVALQPTTPAAELAAQLSARIDMRVRSASGSGDDDDSLSMLLTRLVHAPAHDGDSRSGVSMRVLRSSCFGNARSRFALSSPVSAIDGNLPSTPEEKLLDTPGGAAMPERGAGPNDILRSASFRFARELVLSHGCGVRPRDEGSASPRALNELVGPTDEFPRPSACAADENMVALCSLLKVAAKDREVLAAVSNKNIHAMLSTFLVGVARAKITNALVVALDDETARFARSKGAHTYVRKLVSRTGSTDNHATSGLKFQIIHEFISAGCAVLLSDVDVVWLQNPFTLPSLYRDSDVEGMTDGWDDPTAYGYDWRSGSGSLRLSARNSGLFYVRATRETLAMMGRLKHRMTHEAVWDQTAYNEEMWWAVTPGQPSHGVSARVSNYFCHMNSKTLFRFMLNDGALMSQHRPVSIHINYHPEKLPRMEDVFERYHGIGPDADLGNGVGKPTRRNATGGMRAWHWGVGLKAGKACREAKRAPGGSGSPLGERLRQAGGKAKWSGISGLTFQQGGGLLTPWGMGSWGRVTSEPAAADVLFADFIGQQHMMRLSPAGWPTLVSTRCADFENVTVTVLE